jgi:hypothetical protein
MPVSSELDSFLADVMRINVLRMGGASAGILGSAGSDGEVVDKLKRSAIAFAGEYRKPTARRDELERLANELSGFIQTLQVTSALSEVGANKFLNQLQMLMARAAA